MPKLTKPPMDTVLLALMVAAFGAAFWAIFSLDRAKETPAVPDLGSIEPLPDYEAQTVTGPEVTYIVPDGTETITARIRTPSGDLVREFVITNWISIKPGQRLELSAE